MIAPSVPERDPRVSSHLLALVYPNQTVVGIRELTVVKRYSLSIFLSLTKKKIVLKTFNLIIQEFPVMTDSSSQIKRKPFFSFPDRYSTDSLSIL